VAYVRVVLARTGGRTSARLSGKAKALAQGAAIFVAVLLAGRWFKPADAGLWREIVGITVISVTAWSLADYLRAGWPAVRSMARRRPG
jgi:phosphatidylglycerophosphate synthase